jgi:uncharacterized protein YceK
MNKQLLALLLALNLGGCATIESAADASREYCETHPAACAIGGAVVVGSVAATIDAHERGTGPHPAHNPQLPFVHPIGR